MYCRQCGAEMPADSLVCPSCGISAGSGGNYCANCGASAQPGAVFCSNCGCQFAPEQTQQSYQNVGQQGYSAQGQYYQPPVYPPVAQSQLKSKIAAGLLGIFLGVFGVHNFYLGYTGKAVAQLLITVLSCGILSFVSAIWGLIEGILLLTGSINVDGQGMPLQQ